MLPVRPERDAVVEELRLLTGAVENHDVVAAVEGGRDAQGPESGERAVAAVDRDERRRGLAAARGAEDPSGQRVALVGNLDRLDVGRRVCDESLPRAALLREGRREGARVGERADGVNRDRVVGRCPQVRFGRAHPVARGGSLRGDAVHPLGQPEPRRVPSCVVAFADPGGRREDLTRLARAAGAVTQGRADLVIVIRIR